MEFGMWMVVLAIVFFVVAIISFVLTFKVDYYDMDFFIVLSFITGFAFVVMFLLICYTYDAETTSETTTTDLVSVSSSSSTSGNIHGSAIYIYGSISTEPSFTYYYETEDNGYKSASIPADVTTIYYIEEGETPYLLMSYIKHVKSGEIDESTITYELYVPEGSIESTFDF